MHRIRPLREVESSVHQLPLLQRTYPKGRSVKEMFDLIAATSLPQTDVGCIIFEPHLVWHVLRRCQGTYSLGTTFPTGMHCASLSAIAEAMAGGPFPPKASLVWRELARSTYLGTQSHHCGVRHGRRLHHHGYLGLPVV